MSANGKRGGRKVPAWLAGAIAHHSKTRDESDMGCDWDEAALRCWRCGRDSTLQQCHIVPRSMGGSDEPSNMVALCSRCHDEAPDVASSEMMWMWVKSTRATFHCDIWARRIFDGMRKQDIEYLAQVGEDGVNDIMREAAGMVGIHCGQLGQGAYVKTSSWVAAMSMVIASRRSARSAEAE